jgi:hypothetical protein
MSERQYIEVALYTLKNGVEEAKFLVVSDTASEVYRKLGGFVRREHMKSDDGKWVDMVYWQNRDIAKQAEPVLYQDATIAEVMGLIDTDTMVFTHVEPFRQYN